jgi:hypothetical protein
MRRELKKPPIELSNYLMGRKILSAEALAYVGPDKIIEKEEVAAIRLAFLDTSIVLECSKDGESIEISVNRLLSEVEMGTWGSYQVFNLRQLFPKFPIGETISKVTTVLNCFSVVSGYAVLFLSSPKTFILNNGDNLCLLSNLPVGFSESVDE